MPPTDFPEETLSVMPLYIITQIEGMLPPWAKMHFRSPRAWKTVFRCWVAAWASFVILLPTKSAIELGNAGFFGFIIAVILPPSMPVQMFIFLLGTLCIGMGIGWSLGAAAMKAASAVRSQTLLQSEYLRANQTAAHSANPDSVFNSELFRGDFLDWRSSLIYGVFMAFAAILFSFTRAYYPKLAFFSTFGIIAADVFCTIGPLIPIEQYSIVNTIFISTGCYVGIALICIVVIFPETMSHVHLNMSCGLIALMRNYIEAQDAILAASPEKTTEEVAKKGGAVAANTGLRGKVLMTLQGLKMRNALVEAEFSLCRWSGTDCKKLEDPLELLVSRLDGFQAFPRLIANHSSSIPLSRSAVWQSMLSSTSQVFTEQPPVPPMPPMPQPEGAHEMGLIAQFSSPRQARELTLAATLPRLRVISMPLREACVNALGACAKAIQDVNTHRWSKGSQSSSDVEKMLDAVLENLRHERASFVNDGRLSLADPFVAAIPSLSISSLTKALHATPPLQAFLVASTFSAQLVVVTDAILLLAEFVRSTCAKRRKSRLWAPRGLRALGNWLLRRNKDGEDDDFEDPLATTQHPSSKEDGESVNEKPYRRDPDSRPPSNFLQKIMSNIYKGYKWSKSKEALFMFKYSFMTIALWLPSVFRTTAHIYYVQKGIWALVAAQTIMNVYASDHLYNLIVRCLGTAIGMVIGVMAWYIGSGNGNGNPYGLAASLGVFLVPVIYARIFVPPLSMIPYMMCNATIALVVGFSWLDGTIFTEDNPGVGWPVGWKRVVVVFIGAGASFVMMAVPPVSGRKVVRLHNASIINELGKLYQLLMATWINEEETQLTRIKGRFASTSTIFLTLTQTHTDDEEKVTKLSRYPPVRSRAQYVPQWFAQFRKRVIPLANQLRGLHVATDSAQWEGSIRGAWPVQEYQKLMSIQGEILAALTQLASALSYLEPRWRASLIRDTLVLNPDFMTEVMSVFTVISQALRTGEPLHQIMPSSLLDRLLYHHAHAVSRLPEYERKPRHKKSRPSISEVNRAGLPDSRSRSQGHLQLRPKHKASMMSIVSTAYTDIEQDTGIQEEMLGNATSYEDRIQDINFMYFASAVSAVRQIASCLDELHDTTKELCGEIPFEGFREWRGEYERSFARSV
ncbi:hypothetical protein ACEPAG_8929 [Sanghuangporus baumii]